MTPSLSVRIAEHPREKSRITTDLDELARLAREAGFGALSMRASVVSVASSAEQVQAVRETLDRHGLRVSMLTGDLALAANNAQATDSIRNITPYLDLAEALGCELLRVMVHEAGDIEPLRRAADEAGERGMRLAQQCHWGSLAETVEQALALVREVDRSNFGITYEPANLLAAGDEYGATAVERLAPHLFNVYFQNLHLRADSALTFNTRRRGPVGVEFLPIADPRGIDATPIVQALRAVGYAGWFSVHQPCMPGQSVAEAVREAGAFAARHLGSSRS